MKRIIVNDKMQENYIYNLLMPYGKNFDSDFKPQLTPKQMLELGVFGGKYINDCQSEFPHSWYKNAKLSYKKKNPELNYFQIDASQSLSIWQEKGWIHSDDPRGWFQWYCRYYLGRRHPDDQRQIQRWRSFSRHLNAVVKNCSPGDFSCRTRQRQALLHWAYDSRKI